MGVHVSKSFKFAPGTRVRVNTKSDSNKTRNRRGTTTSIRGKLRADSGQAPAHRIAALTLAGLLTESEDRALAVRVLGEIFASRVEVSGNRFLCRYALVKSSAMPAGSCRQVAVPLYRDVIGMQLVQLHASAGEFDWEKSAQAELKDVRAAYELRRIPRISAMITFPQTSLKVPHVALGPILALWLPVAAAVSG
jgi:hypothetical protein